MAFMCIHEDPPYQQVQDLLMARDILTLLPISGQATILIYCQVYLSSGLSQLTTNNGSSSTESHYHEHTDNSEKYS